MISDGRVLLYFEEPKEMGPVQFYHDMTASVGLVKLVPAMPADILDYVAGRCDAVIIEAFGVGGLPVYEKGSFFDVVHKWSREGKVFVMATQVAREGSNLAVYEVGKKVKEEAGVMEAYDMTLSVIMTILGIILCIIVLIGVYLMIKRIIRYNSELKNGKTKRQTELEKMKIDDLN